MSHDTGEEKKSVPYMSSFTQGRLVIPWGAKRSNLKEILVAQHGPATEIYEEHRPDATSTTLETRPIILTTDPNAFYEDIHDFHVSELLACDINDTKHLTELCFENSLHDMAYWFKEEEKRRNPNFQKGNPPMAVGKFFPGLERVKFTYVERTDSDPEFTVDHVDEILRWDKVVKSVALSLELNQFRTSAAKKMLTIKHLTDIAMTINGCKCHDRDIGTYHSVKNFTAQLDPLRPIKHLFTDKNTWPLKTIDIFLYTYDDGEGKNEEDEEHDCESEIRGKQVEKYRDEARTIQKGFEELREIIKKFASRRNMEVVDTPDTEIYAMMRENQATANANEGTMP